MEINCIVCGHEICPLCLEEGVITCDTVDMENYENDDLPLMCCDMRCFTGGIKWPV